MDTSERSNFAFVLVAPAVVRAMSARPRARSRTWALRDLRMVAPQNYVPRAARRDGGSCRRCPRGGDALSRTSPAALDDRTTGGRHHGAGGPYRARPRSLREVARETWSPASAANRIAVVFGPEDFGLTNQELKLCQRLITIPHGAGLRVAQPRAGGDGGRVRTHDGVRPSPTPQIHIRKLHRQRPWTRCSNEWRKR